MTRLTYMAKLPEGATFAAFRAAVLAASARRSLPVPISISDDGDGWATVLVDSSAWSNDALQNVMSDAIVGTTGGRTTSTPTPTPTAPIPTSTGSTGALPPYVKPPRTPVAEEEEEKSPTWPWLVGFAVVPVLIWVGLTLRKRGATT